MAERINGVNAENHIEKFKLWCSLNGIKKADPVLPVLKRNNRADDGAWNAWRNYFRQKKIGTFYMDSQHKGWAGTFTVPTRWPHEYDSDWLAETDRQFYDFPDPPPPLFPKRSAIEQEEAEALVARYRAEGLLPYDPNANSLTKAIEHPLKDRRPPPEHFQLDD